MARRRFAKRETWERPLFKARYPSGFDCPRCGAKRFWKLDGWLLVECAKGHKVSLTSWSFMHRTHLDPSAWILGAYLAWHWPGISVKQFQKALGLTRPQTAFSVLQRLRAVLPTVTDRLSGYVDVAILDVPTRRHARGKVRPVAPVLCIVEARPNGRAGAAPRDVYLEALPRPLADEWLNDTLYDEVDPDACVRADPATIATAKQGQFKVVEAATSECDPPLVIDEVKASLAQFLQETHHGPVSTRYLHGFLAEFAFHWNYDVWGGFWQTFRTVYASSCYQPLRRLP